MDGTNVECDNKVKEAKSFGKSRDGWMDGALALAQFKDHLNCILVLESDKDSMLLKH